MYIHADGLVNKRQELKALINSVKDYPHVIAVTEIKPKNVSQQLLTIVHLISQVTTFLLTV